MFQGHMEDPDVGMSFLTLKSVSLCIDNETKLVRVEMFESLTPRGIPNLFMALNGYYSDLRDLQNRLNELKKTSIIVPSSSPLASWSVVKVVLHPESVYAGTKVNH